MVLRPVGDLPPSVYWVRRLLVAGALVVVVALVWWLWPNGGDAAPTGGQPTTSPTPTVSGSPSTGAPSPTASETKTKASTKSSKPSKPPCQDSAIEVTVSTDAKTYTSDEQPAITFAVENVSDQTCSRDIGQGANELQITSGGEQVWSSDDCNPGGEPDIDNLGPGDRFMQTVTWPRDQSSQGCPTPQEDASPGSYQVIARNGEVISEPAPFVLE